jgi:hypothetical protein
MHYALHSKSTPEINGIFERNAAPLQNNDTGNGEAKHPSPGIAAPEVGRAPEIGAKVNRTQPFASPAASHKRLAASHCPGVMMVLGGGRGFLGSSILALASLASRILRREPRDGGPVQRFSALGKQGQEAVAQQAGDRHGDPEALRSR